MWVDLMQVSSIAQLGHSRTGSAHASGRVPHPGDNGNGCGCCIDLTGEDSEGSDIEMLAADDVAITGISHDDVAPPYMPLRDLYAGGASSSVHGARSSYSESANTLQSGHGPVRDWQCGVCTLQNDATAAQCGACGTAAYESTPSAAPGRSTAEAAVATDRPGAPAVPDRPGAPAVSGCPRASASGGAIPPTGQHRPPAGHHRQPAGQLQQRVSQWTCCFCTLSNLGHSDHCTACDTWRFSRKLPPAL